MIKLVLKIQIWSSISFENINGERNFYFLVKNQYFNISRITSFKSDDNDLQRNAKSNFLFLLFYFLPTYNHIQLFMQFLPYSHLSQKTCLILGTTTGN